MAEPLFTPRSGIGARYVDPSTKKEYVFTNSGWKPMAVDIKSDVVDNNTFEVKPEEKDLETKLLQGGATREIAMRAITEKRRIAANRKMTDPLNDRTQNDQTNTEILNNKPTSKFEGKTKQQVLKQAFNDGVTDMGELKKIGDMYDMFSEPEADISVIKELVTQRKELADAGFNTQVIDSKLESMGFAKSTEGADVIATGEAAKFAPAVSRALAQMEEASGIGTDESIFTGGGTSATKILTGVRNFGRKAVDAEFSQKTERYNNMVELAIGSMNKMMGAGTLNEGEALRLLENVPNDNTSENVARAWMNDVRKVFGVDMNKVDKGIYANAGSTLGDNNQDDTTGNPFYNAKDLGTAVSGAGESLAKRGQAIMNTLERGNRGELGPGVLGAVRGQLRVAGEVAGAVGDLGFEVLGLLSPKFVDDIASSAAGEVAGTEIVQAAAQKYEQLKEAYPEATKDLEAVFNIASLLPMEKAIGAGAKGLAKLGGKTTSQAVENIAGVASRATDEGLGKVSKITGKMIGDQRLGRIATVSEKLDKVIGQTIQGTPADIKKAKRVLANIEIDGIENAADMGNRIDDYIEATANKVDERLAVDTTKYKPTNLVKDTIVGDGVVRQEFVAKALNDLSEMYTVTNDPVMKAEIQNLLRRYETEGLTLNEVNNIARQYNTVFQSKAFNQRTGDALTSVNAQAYENTRKGVKEVVRDKMPDDTTKLLDGFMSDLYNTKRLVNKIEIEADRLWNKAIERGIVERATGKLAEIVDVVTMRGVSGFISKFIPRNAGYKSMNAIDIDKALKKNLQEIEKLLKIDNDKALSNGIVNMVAGKGGILSKTTKTVKVPAKIAGKAPVGSYVGSKEDK